MRGYTVAMVGVGIILFMVCVVLWLIYVGSPSRTSSVSIKIPFAAERYIKESVEPTPIDEVRLSFGGLPTKELFPLSRLRRVAENILSPYNEKLLLRGTHYLRFPEREKKYLSVEASWENLSILFYHKLFDAYEKLGISLLSVEIKSGDVSSIYSII